MRDISFDGRVALITGAGSSLGREYALELARRGARLFVNDIGERGGNGSLEPADEVVDEIRAAGGTAIASYHSAATRQGGTAIVHQTLDAYGRLDILISNAGILADGGFEDLTDDQIDRVIDVSLKGGFYVGQPAFRAMKQQGYGRILFAGSASGLFGHPWQANYGAAKAGLVGLSNIIALEGRPHGICSNVLLPAAVAPVTQDIDWNWVETAPKIGAAFTALERPDHRARMSARAVMPLAVYLVSEACQTSHGVYSAVAGRYARVFIGVGEGWTASDAASASPEDVAANWARIEDTVRFTTPITVYHEILDVQASKNQPT